MGKKGNRGTVMSLNEFNNTPTAAEERRQAEAVARQAAFYQAATALGEAQFIESTALMDEENEARETLRERMATAQRFVQAMLNRSMNELAAEQKALTTAERIAGRNAAAVQKMRERNGVFKPVKPTTPELTVSGHALRAPGKR